MVIPTESQSRACVRWLVVACCAWVLTVRHAWADAPATRPVPELNLLAMGDWGEAKSAQKSVADAMASYLKAQEKPFTALLSCGDNFYVPLAGVDDPNWQIYFERMYDAKTFDFPFYISLGNHDYDPGKVAIELAYAKEHPDSRWKLPARYYRIDLPANEPLVTVLMLDSNFDNIAQPQWEVQRQWLAAQLGGPRAPWTICVAHHPLFSNGAAADNGILQRDWGTLFKQHKVDVYLSGHEHNLQHLEIRDWPTSFIIAGGGGAHAHPLLRDTRGPFSRSVYGFAHFDFTPDRLTVRYVGTDGKTLHAFDRTKAGEVRVMETTPSDPGISDPLKVIQGLYGKRKVPQTQPAAK